MLIAGSLIAWGQVGLPQTAASRSAGMPSPPRDDAKKDLDNCRAYRVTSLPGSHHFGSEFIVALASSFDPKANASEVVWGLTADLSDTIPARDRAMYISKSIDGGETWTEVIRLDSEYFNAKIGEGLRNGLSASPDGTGLVFTTQLGAFEVKFQPGTWDAEVKPIPGPRVPSPRPRLSRPKRPGDPIMAGVVQMTADGKKMLVGYGYFDHSPQLFTYHKDGGGSWVEGKPLPHLPTDLDILSLKIDGAGQLDNAGASYYVGTGDQAYRLNQRTMKWIRVAGVGDDSAIHGISVIGGPHFAACWGVYTPLSADAVKRVTEARFLLHRFSEEVGPNIRAYGIEVDPGKANREIVTAITGAYVSDDGGESWRRLNDLPEGEYRSAHFNPDGSVIVSGIPGTFLANPFSTACSPRLRTRER